MLSAVRVDNILAETRRFWQERAGVQFCDEDAREMIHNVTGFFELLATWDGCTSDTQEISSPHGSEEESPLSSPPGTAPKPQEVGY